MVLTHNHNYYNYNTINTIIILWSNDNTIELTWEWPGVHCVSDSELNLSSFYRLIRHSMHTVIVSFLISVSTTVCFLCCVAQCSNSMLNNTPWAITISFNASCIYTHFYGTPTIRDIKVVTSSSISASRIDSSPQPVL